MLDSNGVWVSVLWGGFFRSQPNESVVHLPYFMHEDSEFGDLGVGYLVCFDMAFCIDAVIDTVSVDEPL